MTCPFCQPDQDDLQEIVLENEHCWFLQTYQPVLKGSGIIVPKQHRETVFDLTPEEWMASHELLQRAKAFLDRECSPQGYNVGWNAGPAAGQDIPHAHLHVIPRFADEPKAGRGIRYWLKQDDNKRS